MVRGVMCVQRVQTESPQSATLTVYEKPCLTYISAPCEYRSAVSHKVDYTSQASIKTPASKFFSLHISHSVLILQFLFFCTGTMIPNWFKKKREEQKKTMWQVFVWKAFERGCKVNLALLRMISKLLFCMVSTCERPFIL